MRGSAHAADQAALYHRNWVVQVVIIQDNQGARASLWREGLSCLLPIHLMPATGCAPIKAGIAIIRSAICGAAFFSLSVFGTAVPKTLKNRMIRTAPASAGELASCS